MGKIKISILDPFECISDNNEEKIVSYLSSLFGDTEGKRLKRIGNSPSRISSVGGLLALSFCVGGKKADIFRGENGKPYFFDNEFGCFSISHSGKASVAAYGRTAVGVDIERVNAQKDLSKIAKRFFTQAELKAFMFDPSAQSFYEIWTRKEGTAFAVPSQKVMKLPT